MRSAERKVVTMNADVAVVDATARTCVPILALTPSMLRACDRTSTPLKLRFPDSTNHPKLQS